MAHGLFQIGDQVACIFQPGADAHQFALAQMGGPWIAHGCGVVGHNQTDGTRPTVADAESLQAFAESVHLALRVGIVNDDADNAGCAALRVICRAAVLLPCGMPRGLGQAGVQYLQKLWLLLAPLGDGAGVLIGFLVVSGIIYLFP